jgi:hypothetical protein
VGRIKDDYACHVFGLYKNLMTIRHEGLVTKLLFTVGNGRRQDGIL